MPGHPFYGTEDWKRTRKAVLVRDRYTCVVCGTYLFMQKHRLRVDHVIERRERPDLALVMDNLRTLCVGCDAIRHRLKGGGGVVGCDAGGVPLAPGHHWRGRKGYSLLLMLGGVVVLGACNTTPMALCPAVPQPAALSVACVQQPKCKHHCYTAATVAEQQGAGTQTVSESNAPTTSETNTNTGPIP